MQVSASITNTTPPTALDSGKEHASADIAWIKQFQPKHLRKALAETPKPLLMKKVFVYLRYSTDAQKKFNFKLDAQGLEREIEDSIARQKDICLSYAARLRLSVTEIIIDRAKSGQLMSRHGFDRVLELCRQNPGSILLVENVDRILRSMEVLWSNVSALRLAGTIIHDAGGVQDDLTLMVNGYMAAKDREKQWERQHYHRAKLMADGALMGTPAYGYVKLGKHDLAVSPEQAKVVVEIFELCSSGLTHRQICEELNRRGVPAPAGGKWNIVSKILHNPIYVGLVESEMKVRVARLIKLAELSEDQDPDATVKFQKYRPELAVVSRELWTEVQKRSAKYNDRKMPSGQIKYLLSRKVKCPECAAKMHIAGSIGNNRWLVCPEFKRGTGCGHSRYYSMAALEQGALLALLSAVKVELKDFQDRVALEYGELVEQYDEDRQSLKDRMDTLNRQIDNAMQMAFTDPRLAALQQSKMQALLDQIDDLRAERSKIPSTPPALESGFALPTFQDMIQDIAGAVPFRPAGSSEQALFAEIQSTISAVQILSVSGTTAKVNFEFDFGSALGDGYDCKLNRVIEVDLSKFTQRDTNLKLRADVEVHRDLQLSDNHFVTLDSHAGMDRAGAMFTVEERRTAYDVFCLASHTSVGVRGACKAMGVGYPIVSDVFRVLHDKGDLASWLETVTVLRPDIRITTRWTNFSQPTYRKKFEKEAHAIMSLPHVDPSNMRGHRLTLEEIAAIDDLWYPLCNHKRRISGIEGLFYLIRFNISAATSDRVAEELEKHIPGFLCRIRATGEFDKVIARLVEMQR